MKLSKEHKEALMTCLIEDYQKKEGWGVHTDIPEVKEIVDALGKVFDMDAYAKRGVKLFLLAVSIWVDFYEHAEPFELWFSQHVKSIRELEIDQIKNLATRIELYAMELEQKKEKE